MFRFLFRTIWWIFHFLKIKKKVFEIFENPKMRIFLRSVLFILSFILPLWNFWSLSKEPATEREIYPGAIAMKAALKSPAPGDHISLVKRYVAIAVNPEKIGAVKTHTS